MAIYLANRILLKAEVTECYLRTFTYSPAYSTAWELNQGALDPVR